MKLAMLGRSVHHRFLKLGILVVAVMAVATGLLGATTATASDPTLNWGSQLNAAQCGSGRMVINVTEKVVNDIDSGVGGNNWAFDDYIRQIQVRETGSGTYCAVVRYHGSFTTIAGFSPQNTGTVAAGITGTFEGGFRATITGTLLSSPGWSTHGFVGTFDYACDATTSVCPGYVSWLGQYFSAVGGFDQPWWGWIYRTECNGTWVNASDGNLGDITGLASADCGDDHGDDHGHHGEDSGHHGEDNGHHGDGHKPHD